MRTEKHKLDNGLTVLLKESRHAPVTTFWIWYRVGSRNEVPGITGIAHWAEHMLFKGSQAFPKGEIDKQIARNGGLDGSIVAQKVDESSQTNFGFNALTQEYEDLVKAGVIVPTKVERIALQNAASISGLLLTTDCAITEIKEKKQKAGAAAGGGMDDFDY